MSGYSSQGVGQALGQTAGQQTAMSGGLGDQYPVTPASGGQLAPNSAFEVPQSVQRMPGGFGLSPQLLQMISQLQSRTPQGNAFNPQQFMQPKPVMSIRNPYSGSHAGNGGNGTTGY